MTYLMHPLTILPHIVLLALVALIRSRPTMLISLPDAQRQNRYNKRIAEKTYHMHAQIQLSCECQMTSVALERMIWRLG